MKSKSYLILLAATAALFIGSTGSTARAASSVVSGGTPPAHTPFGFVVLKDFAAWDTDHDGVLSMDEINHLVQDPTVKGDDAAAAGAIKLLSRNKRVKLPPLTKDYFADYDQKALASMIRRGATTAPTDAITATVDPLTAPAATQPAGQATGRTRIAADFDLYFAASKQRIARGGSVQYPARFVLEHTRQGPLGDCFFVAAISTMMIHDPARLEKMIEVEPNGSYLVKLPSTQPIAVPALTDAELALSSTTAGDGAWLAIMEQAFGKYKSRARGKSEDVEGTEIIRTGGDSGPTIEALTGHKFMRISPGKTMEIRKENADNVLPKLRTALAAGMADHRLMTAGMDPWLPTTRPAAEGNAKAEKIEGTPVHIPPNITINHVYAVVSYDPATDIIELWNPHGQQFTPKGEPGLTNGFATDHGRFKLPLTQAYQFYTSFTFETPGPASNAGVASN